VVCELIWNRRPLSKNANFFISTIVSLHANFRARILKFKMKLGLLNLYGHKKFRLPESKIWGDIGVTIFSSPPPSSKYQSGTYPDFFACRARIVRAKNPESFEKIHSGDFEIFRISYVAPMLSTDCVIPIVGVDIRYSFTKGQIQRKRVPGGQCTTNSWLAEGNVTIYKSIQTT